MQIINFTLYKNYNNLNKIIEINCEHYTIHYILYTIEKTQF